MQAAGGPRRRADIVGCSSNLSTRYMPSPLACLLIGLIDLHQPDLAPAVLCRPAAAIPSPLMSITSQSQKSTAWRYPACLGELLLPYKYSMLTVIG